MTTALVPNKINDICPSCHPTKHTKTTATFIKKEDEAVDEYLYQCDKCSAKLWITQKWAVQNKVKEKDLMTKKQILYRNQSRCHSRHRFITR